MRNLKVLGLLLIAMLAMSAVAASAASAVSYHSESELTTLTASQIGTDVFTTNAGTVKCEEATYHGTTSAKTLSKITLAPTYSGCTAFGFAGYTITMNGCEYEFTTPTGSAGTYSADIDIVCPEGQTITVVAKLAGTTKCTVHIGAQTLKGALLIHNKGSGSSRDIEATVKITTDIDYSQTAGSGLGACKTENGLTNGSYEGVTTVKGDVDGTNVQTGLWVE